MAESSTSPVVREGGGRCAATAPASDTAGFRPPVAYLSGMTTTSPRLLHEGGTVCEQVG